MKLHLLGKLKRKKEELSLTKELILQLVGNIINIEKYY